MNYFYYLFLVVIIAFPVKGFTCSVTAPSIENDLDPVQLTAYYDLRQRNSSIQVTNTNSDPARIHIQIFQHDRGCDELDFFDDLTANDTVVYDMDNIIKNDGSPAPINLADDSNGYVVVTAVQSTNNDAADLTASLIGNFRIIDDTNYEYRSNMNSFDSLDSTNLNKEFLANFNTVDNAKFADVVGYSFDSGAGQGNFSASVVNHDEGFSFDIFVFDLNEEPLSCDRRTFACGKVMNYGINEDYKASRGNDLICPGGGLANNLGGYINFANITDNAISPSPDNRIFFGLIGINNNDGTGSMDTWLEFEPIITPPG